ncbi:preprotein translocase subunit SecE [Candidatus Venteria ishoeyi]|uniref:Protein translocase subunit SecE n=1 Tax=Candidatus Venteria ishoeyi TaxID=1899563 RepID=A0A1H6FG24_9GAMM|nr:preprotein translocase subunit SecE [Candidatus Venteria ishoeyi]MDM8547540.1 preprotein translocase subunit SecE [Candidatus Venteria ishoeyi]SEH08361.1 preprotein translocase subunit SecE [Candidatus Venteria ishoeyi]
MSTKAEAAVNKSDLLKWAVAWLLLVAGLAGFYYFSDSSTLLRVLGLLLTAGVFVAIALTTDKGQSIWSFAKDSRTEVRKVVWPSRQETLQTTLIVIVVVIIMALLIWLVDSLLLWIVRALTGS